MTSALRRFVMPWWSIRCSNGSQPGVLVLADDQLTGAGETPVPEMGVVNELTARWLPDHLVPGGSGLNIDDDDFDG